ncbi:MAG: NmrA family transcriptional regulator [Myxococcota bacterium]
MSSRLTDRGIAHRAASRRSSPAFDWYAPGTWPTALEGVNAVYATFIPDLAVPGAPEIIGAFVKAAKAAGVRRVVLLSERREPGAAACEALLRESSLEWTILQASWFMENFSEGGFVEGIEAGLLSVPVHGTREPFVDLDDLADVAVAALLEDRHVGQTYEVTGPELLSFDDAVGRIAQAVGRPVRFEPCSAAEFQDTLVAGGVEANDANFVAGLVESILDGRNENLGDGVERALGRAPAGFDAFVERAVNANVWTLGEEKR